MNGAQHTPVATALVPVEPPEALAPLLTGYSLEDPGLSERDREAIVSRLRTRWASILVAASSGQAERREYDEAIEALRRGLNKLPRYSFWTDGNGGVDRVPDRAGRWIDWQSAHELFDAATVDALLAAMRADRAIANAAGGAQ